MSKTGFKGGRLGIGPDDPIYPLDVVGDIRLTGGFRDASGNDFNFIALAGPDVVRTSDLADSITGIICKDNCVGIFNNNPSQSLDVSGNIRLTGDLLDINGAARVFSNWTIDGTNIFRNSKVTIGDNSVNTNYSLYVNGDVKFSETNVSKLHIHSTDGGASDSSPQILITRDPASNYNQWASLELRGSYIGNTVTYGVGIRTTYGWNSNNRDYGDFSIYTYDKDNGNAKTDRLTVTSGGNVGIGTASPDCLLHLKTETAANVGIADNDTPAAGYHDEFMALKIESQGDTGDVNSISAGIKFASWANPDNSYPNVSPVGSLRFYVNSPGNSSNAYGTTPNTMVMSLAGNGNVGIGTTSPSEKLQVNGRLRIEAADHSAGVWFVGNGVANDNGSMFFGRAGATFSGIGFWVDDWIHAFLDNGNVGIGTTEPTKYYYNGNENGQSFSSSERILTIHGGTSGLTNGNCRIVLSCDANHTSSILAQHTGGGNTYMSFFTTTGTAAPSERMRIDKDGNVGIGTTDPVAKLHVEGKTISEGLMIASRNIYNTSSRPALATRNSSTSIKDYEISAIPHNNTNFTSNYGWDHGFLRIRAGGGTNTGQTSYIDLTGYSQNADMTRNIVFGTSGNERMRINSSGNVGIGTTSPSTLLQIKGNGDSNNVQLLIENESYNKGIQFQYKSASTSTAYNFPQARIWTSGSSYDTKLYFSTAKGSSNSDTVLSTAMTIDYDGNVGIGETSPGAPLHIKFTQSGDPTNNIKDMIKLETQYSTDFGGSYREGGSSILFYVENTTDQGLPGEAARIVAGCYESSSSTEYHSYLAFHTSNNSGSTGTNERMVIDDNGHVGIGTTEPGYTLDVHGSIATSGSTMVFEDYGERNYTNTIKLEAWGHGMGNGRGLNFYLRKSGTDIFRIYSAGINNFATTGRNTTSLNMYRAGKDFALGAFLTVNAYSGSVTTPSNGSTSDDRVKHNEKEILNGLETIKKLKPTKYFKTTDQVLYDENHNFPLDSSGNPLDESGNIIKLDIITESGFIAQRILEIDELKHLVIDGGEDPSGNELPYSLCYNGLIAYNVKAIQELDEQQQADKSKIAELEAKNTELETKVTTLESTLETVLARLTELENTPTDEVVV